jgi:hypothetical protein
MDKFYSSTYIYILILRKIFNPMFEPYSYKLTTVKDSPWGVLNHEVNKYSESYRKEASK